MARNVGEPRQRPVLVGQNHVLLIHRPADADGRIVPCDAAIMLRTVGCGDLVADDAVRLERCESMRKAGRNPDLYAVFRREFPRQPLAKAGRACADIDGDIHDAAGKASHQLALREGRCLEMQSPDSAGLRRKQFIVLDECDVRHVVAEPGILEDF